MLVQFVVENFRSFKNETVFNLTATKDESHSEHILTQGAKPVSALRAAALYGANASGKSNLIKAISHAHDFILEGTRRDDPIPYHPYKLSRETVNMPSSFEFTFVQDGVLYVYGFAADPRRVSEEWLFATPGKREVKYFERITDERGNVTIEFGKSFAGKTQKERLFSEFVGKGTRPNQLFLTEFADKNAAAVEPIIKWFKQVLSIIPAESRSLTLNLKTYKDHSFMQFLEEFLSHAGTGISAVEANLETLNIERHLLEIPNEIKEEIFSDASKLKNDECIVFGGTSREIHILMRDEQGEPAIILLKTKHEAESGEVVSFDLHDESEGTQRLINLATALADARYQDKVYIIDEIDRRLHPLLSRLFIEIFLQKSTKSQLIFTTHETNLLDLELLRRDEIWFVEKNQTGASHLYSLVEFKVREDLKISKGYLNGRFGAIPFIGDISKLRLNDSQPVAERV